MFALILKDPSKTQEDDDGRPRAMAPDEEPQKADKKKGEGEGDEEDEDEDAKEELKKNVEFKLPDEKKLEEAREKRLKEKKMKAIIREIIIHLMFVLVCLFIGYSTMDPFAYRLGESVKNLVSKAGLTVAYNGSGKALTDVSWYHIFW